MSSLVISPEAPLALHVAAKAVLVLHIGGGVVGIGSGAVALLTRKGERIHQVAGNVFFAAMLTMTVIAAAVAPFLPEDRGRRPPRRSQPLSGGHRLGDGEAAGRRDRGLERLAVVIPLGVVLMAAWLALAAPAAKEETGFSTVYAFAVLSALAAACDLKLIARRGLRAERRIARHVWRMSLGLFVATGSLFLGQQQVFPEALRGTAALTAPPLLVLAALSLWMLKVRFGRTFKPAPAAA